MCRILAKRQASIASCSSRSARATSSARSSRSTRSAIGAGAGIERSAADRAVLDGLSAASAEALLGLVGRAGAMRCVEAVVRRAGFTGCSRSSACTSSATSSARSSRSAYTAIGARADVELGTVSSAGLDGLRAASAEALFGFIRDASALKGFEAQVHASITSRSGRSASTS